MEEAMEEKYRVLEEAIEGGPMNPALLKSFRGHVAYYIWHGREHKVLKGHKQTKRLLKWVPNSEGVKNLIAQSGLSHLSTCMQSHLDMPLIYAFIERWQPETNSFHLPFGEMTITLHDVAFILGIPIVGKAVSGKILVSKMKENLCTSLNLSQSDVEKEYSNAVIKLDTIQNCCNNENTIDVSFAQGYLLWLLGCTLFVDRSSGCVTP